MTTSPSSKGVPPPVDPSTTVPDASTRELEASRRAPLVGREHELSRLRALHQAVRESGKPQTVAVTGAAGIGKTRLVREFLLQEKGSRVYRAQARENDPGFGVFARLLRGRFGLIEGAQIEVTREKLRAGLAELFGDRKVGDVCYLLGGLMGIEFQDTPLLKALSSEPEQLAMSRRAVLQRLIDLDAKAGDGQLVLVFDDMHHAHQDAHSLLLELAAAASGPVLFVVVGRPELLARHEGWAHSQKLARTWLELGPLDDTESEQVMRELLAPAVPDGEEGAKERLEALDELVDYGTGLAMGNPSLLEQMVHVFHDMGVLTSEDPFSEYETWTIHPERMDEARLPLTVEDAVFARIAALAPKERELLERAAVMGGVFWLGGLLAIERAGKSSPLFWERGNEYDRSAAEELLGELVERDYVLKLPDSAFAGELEYVFKHNLERETLVRGVPVATARRWHHAIAEWLSLRDAGETNDEHLTMLARHYRDGGRSLRAGLTYFRAAAAARAQYANAKAAELYLEGVMLLRENDQISPEVWLRVHHDHGDALHAIGKNDMAQDAYREMLALAYALDLPGKGGAAHAKLGRLFRDTGRLRDAEDHLQAALTLFNQSRDTRGIASTTDDLGKLAWLRGESDAALAMTERALVQRRALGDTRSVAVSLNNLGLILQDRGELMRATEAFEQTLSLRRELGDLVGVAVSLNNLGAVAQDQGDDPRALEMYLEALGVAKEAGDKARQADILGHIGETYLRLLDPAKALGYVARAEKLADELGDVVVRADALRLAARAHVQKEDAAEARVSLSKAVELYRQASHRMSFGLAMRELADAQARGLAPEADAARRSYLESVATFEGLGNDIELSRTLTAYAKFLKNVEPYRSSDAFAKERGEYADRAKELAMQVGNLPSRPKR